MRGCSSRLEKSGGELTTRSGGQRAGGRAFFLIPAVTWATPWSTETLAEPTPHDSATAARPAALVLELLGPGGHMGTERVGGPHPNWPGAPGERITVIPVMPPHRGIKVHVEVHVAAKQAQRQKSFVAPERR